MEFFNFLLKKRYPLKLNVYICAVSTNRHPESTQTIYYGKIRKSLFRLRLQAHLRQRNQQRFNHQFSKQRASGRSDCGYHFSECRDARSQADTGQGGVRYLLRERERGVLYASFAIQRQALRIKEKTRRDTGNIYQHWHYGIQKVYIVCILNYIMDSRYPDKYRWDVVRMDRELKIPFSETLCEVYLEMPKFSLPLSQCTTTYLKWLYVLNNIEIMERLPEQLNNQLFQKLKSIVEIERMSVDERLEYELSLATERDILSAMETKFEDGKAEGKQEVASSMKRQGFDTETIANCTGLSVEEINRL